MNKIAFAGVALAAAAALPALAQRGPEGPARGAEPMTRAAVEAKVQAHFAKVDANRDGFVTQEEAQAVHAALRERFRAKGGERRAALFARLDANNDGSITRAEFDAAGAARGEGQQGPRGHGMRHGPRGAGGHMAGGFREPFAMLDSDHDGRVSLQEARSRALAMFDRADANRDGTVTPEERRSARQALRAQRGG